MNGAVIEAVDDDEGNAHTAHEGHHTGQAEPADECLPASRSQLVAVESDDMNIIHAGHSTRALVRGVSRHGQQSRGRGGRERRENWRSLPCMAARKPSRKIKLGNGIPAVVVSSIVL